MDNEAKIIVERILGMCNLILVPDETDYPNYDDGIKKMICLRDTGHPKRRFWLAKDTGDIENTKYDNLFVIYDKDESLDLIYGLFLEYISENSLFKICEEDDNGNSNVRFLIPSFTNLSELQIKLDMI